MRRRLQRLPRALSLLILSAVTAAPGRAQTLPEGPLGDLYLAREGGLVHFSSTDLTGGNDDRWPLAPGETAVLMDYEGTGVVRRWWVTIAPRETPEIQRGLIVRCYWDGEDTPSVEVPVNDFFGMGFGEWKDYISLPINMTSGGFNTYWPMPFRRHARITIENTSDVPVQSLYFNIDVRTYESLPDDALYFHAQFRQTRTRAGEPVHILETTGRGHYVGTLISMQPEQGSGLGYLEGDEQIYVDGEETPSVLGTGTEDYFSSGWYYITGEYAAPYHGVTVKDEQDGRINSYRWHIEDPIPFQESFRFDIEHGGTNNAPGVRYATVAFWYQTHPHAPFPPLPENLLPLSRAAVPEIEAEALLDRVAVTSGRVQIQDMSGFDGTWGGGEQLWWVEADPGSRLTIPLQAPAAGTYELMGYFTRARDYGIVRMHVNGTPVGSLMDGYNESVEPTGPISFGQVELREGENELVVELVGKDARSSGYSNGYLVGIDGFALYR